MSEEFNQGMNCDKGTSENQQTASSDGGQSSSNMGAQADGGTTYSWVNPRLRQEEDAKRRNQQAQPNYGWQSQGQSTQQNSGQGGYQYTTYHPGMGPMNQTGRQKRNKKAKVKKPRQPMSTGKKWVMTVAMALVFGLVAGTVFYGVNLIGEQLWGAEDIKETTQPSLSIGNTGSVDEPVTTPASGSANAGTVASVAANAMPSLVTISTMSVEEMQSFFGRTESYEVEGAGTGVIVGQNETELLIATNNHVINGATSLSVGFIDETSVEARVKGADPNSDLAVVAVKLENIPAETMDQIKIATLGDSDALALGEQVVAIGNALGYGQSVTGGYVSAVDRDLTISDGNGVFVSTGLIQTDAAINSGNSGGALLNMKGELIGINEAKSSMTSSGTTVNGVGFAIPIAKAKPILEELMALTTREKVEEAQAGYLGVNCADVTADISQMYSMPTGVCFTNVVDGGPADKAGVKKGDVLTKLDGREIRDYASLKEVLAYYAAGEEIEIVVQRSNEGEYQEKKLTLTLGTAADVSAQSPSGNSGNKQLFPNSDE